MVAVESDERVRGIPLSFKFEEENVDPSAVR
jgi:hypothetical protein